MADAAEKRMTVAEFLAWDDGTDTRYELIDGRPVAMAPAAPSHSIIASKIAGALERRRAETSLLREHRGWVTTPDRSDTFYEADVVVSCSPRQPGMTTIPEPVIVIEVLSPSTIEHDRGRKA